MRSLPLITAPVQITGRRLNHKLKAASEFERALIIDDLRTGKLVVTDFTTPQVRHLVAASLVVVRRPPDEKRQTARLDHQADQAIERLGPDRLMRALDRFTSPILEGAE